MPVVVNEEQWNRLQKRMDKGEKLGKQNQPQPLVPEPRHLFLRYKKRGKHRVKRLTVKNEISGAGIQDRVIVKFKMISPKNGQKEAIALELGPDLLEPLLTKTLEHLGANPGELNYYWECE